jgi:hypothetical protein
MRPTPFGHDHSLPPFDFCRKDARDKGARLSYWQKGAIHFWMEHGDVLLLFFDSRSGKYVFPYREFLSDNGG